MLLNLFIHKSLPLRDICHSVNKLEKKKKKKNRANKGRGYKYVNIVSVTGVRFDPELAYSQGKRTNTLIISENIK